MNSNILNEDRYHEVKGILSNVPYVSKSQLINQLEEGDILITRPYDTSTNNFSPKVFFSNMISWFQKSTFSSSKMYIGDGYVAGYGAVPGIPVNGIVKFPVSTFIDTQQRVLLIRPKNYTQGQRDRAVLYMKQRLGLPYDKSMILKSAWNRFIKKNPKILEISDVEELEKIRTPLICSSVLFLALIYSGNNAKVSNNVLEVWPVDFVVSEDMEKICMYEK